MLIVSSPASRYWTPGSLKAFRVALVKPVAYLSCLVIELRQQGSVFQSVIGQSLLSDEELFELYVPMLALVRNIKIDRSTLSICIKEFEIKLFYRNKKAYLDRADAQKVVVWAVQIGTGIFSSMKGTKEELISKGFLLVGLKEPENQGELVGSPCPTEIVQPDAGSPAERQDGLVDDLIDAQVDLSTFTSTAVSTVTATSTAASTPTPDLVALGHDMFADDALTFSSRYPEIPALDAQPPAIQVPDSQPQPVKSVNTPLRWHRTSDPDKLFNSAKPQIEQMIDAGVTRPLDICRKLWGNINSDASPYKGKDGMYKRIQALAIAKAKTSRSGDRPVVPTLLPVSSPSAADRNGAENKNGFALSGK